MPNLSKLPDILQNEGYKDIPSYMVLWRFACRGKTKHIRKVRGQWIFDVSDLPEIAKALDCCKVQSNG